VKAIALTNEAIKDAAKGTDIIACPAGLSS
jgi:hypothetical protein